MARSLATLTTLGLLAACAIPRTVDRLQERNPPPEFGRPGWVRFCAGTGAWIGGIVGGAASIVLLPITWPLGLLAGDDLGEASREELMLMPAIGGAAAGHFLLGGSTDVLDFVFYRAWFGEQLPVYTYELVPMEPPMTPQPADPAPVQAPAEKPPAEKAGEKPAEKPGEPTRSGDR